ncbi:MAG TPA: hypothetical protein PK082_02880 [Phycisphaerae bacterium]|nr:hypothetical protein [Phycisphaerae bacterium]
MDLSTKDLRTCMLVATLMAMTSLLAMVLGGVLVVTTAIMTHDMSQLVPYLEGRIRCVEQRIATRHEEQASKTSPAAPAPALPSK